jgi:2-polyprenyl-6-hydroxyphenyl methylase/3-demethylubiquinone-9 3-methyltransferase
MISDSTIDPREVAFYENLAAFWWDRAGPFWPLHRLNGLRVSWIRERLCDHFGMPRDAALPLAGLRILDIGCGGGILAESMARLGAAVRGIDVVEKNIRIASVHARQQGLEIDYRACTAESLAAAGARYDVVLNMEVVEHVADLPAFMAACNRLVAPGGAMFIATINRTALAWLFAIVGAEYILRWLPRGTHRWQEFREPSELRDLLARDGLQVCSQSGVTINALTRTFHLTDRMQVNYMLMAHAPGA